jgi:hypothetical protein
MSNAVVPRAGKRRVLLAANARQPDNRPHGWVMDNETDY